MTVTKAQLIDGVHRKTGLTKADSGKAIAATLEVIREALAKGEKVQLIGHGSYEVRARAARTGQNPRTGEQIKIAATKVAIFRPGLKLRTAVKGGE